jgi:two-component system, NarL family, response regulator LiaR
MNLVIDQQPQTPIHVVLIEDHELTRVSMRLALQKLGGVNIIGEASDGNSGLELVKKLQPDVAIVDLGLPELDGIELTRRLKQSHVRHPESPLSEGTNSDNRGDSTGYNYSQNPVPKVLILTLRDNEQEVLAAFGAGADSYCMKDIAPETLKAAIQSTYEGQHWIDPAIAGVVLQQSRQLATLPNGVEVKSQKQMVHASLGSSLNSNTDADLRAEQAAAAIPSILSLSERELEVLQLIVEGLSNAAIAERLYITVGTVKTHVRNLLNKLCADDRTQAAVMALRSGLIH